MCVAYAYYNAGNEYIVLGLSRGSVSFVMCMGPAVLGLTMAVQALGFKTKSYASFCDLLPNG